MDNSIRDAWYDIFQEFRLMKIEYEILDNSDIQFLDEHYDLGVSIIEKHLNNRLVTSSNVLN